MHRLSLRDYQARLPRAIFLTFVCVAFANMVEMLLAPQFESICNGFNSSHPPFNFHPHPGCGSPFVPIPVVALVQASPLVCPILLGISGLLCVVGFFLRRRAQGALAIAFAYTLQLLPFITAALLGVAGCVFLPTSW